MTVIRGSFATTLVAVLLVVAAGCGGSNRAAVTGEVTLDGQPVEGGTISFIPADGAAGPPAWGKIEAGRYSIPAREGPPPGTSRVEIRWTRKTGRKLPAVPPAPPGEMIEETVEAVPARYNARSELKAEVQGGKNTFDFKLKSQ